MSTRRRMAPGLLVGALLMGPGAVPASAEPTPTPSPSSSVPSADEVQRAEDAVDAAARQITQVEAELDEARRHLERVHEEAAIAAESYNEAKALLAKRTADATAARAQAETAKAEAAQAELDVQHLAAQVYMQGGSLGGFELLLGLHRGDLARRAADVDAAMGFRTDARDRAAEASKRAQDATRAAAQAELQQKAASAAAEKALAKATKAADAAEREATRIEADQARLVTRLAELRRTSLAVEQRRQEGLQEAARAAEEARVRQAQEARATQEMRAPQDSQAARSSGSGAATSGPTGPLPEPKTAAAATAIAFAKAQLGDPYLWAGGGPDRWDCSGLTMGAWNAAGASLPHYSGWQYQQTARVPIADLEPGDLVFFGKSASSIYHVGLYVGGGQMIEAPRSGLTVRYASIYRSSLLPYGGRV